MEPTITLHPKHLLPTDVDVLVTDIAINAESVQVTLIAQPPAACCPCCSTASVRIHSRYMRSVADLPWGTHRVQYLVQVRRFRCAEPACPRTIFTERLPTLMAPYARRTTRLTAICQLIGLVVGGRPGVRVASRLGLPVSLSSLLRLVRQVASPPAPPLSCVGIDDFALRRGQRYGTVLVDLERHALVDLLPERTADSTAAWLAQHPEVNEVSRDRAGLYAEGARRGAPQASQIADRWHLLHSLTEALQRVVSRSQAALQQAVATVAATAQTPAPPRRPVAARPPNQQERRRQASTARRQARYDTIHQLHAAGASITSIAAQVGAGRQTVRRYLRADAPPADLRGHLPSQVAPFESYLRERWAAGQQNISALWREIRARGYTGGLTSVWDYVARWRTTRGRQGPAARHVLPPSTPPPPSLKVPSVRQATWWLLTAPEDLTPEERAVVAEVCHAVPALETARTLVGAFSALVREHRLGDLAAWLTQAAASGIPEFAGVAQSLRQDQQAVEAAITSPTSNGQVEGQVTRIKLIKRMMYGRAKFDLLRLRVLYRDTTDGAAA